MRQVRLCSYKVRYAQSLLDCPSKLHSRLASMDQLKVKISNFQNKISFVHLLALLSPSDDPFTGFLQNSSAAV